MSGTEGITGQGCTGREGRGVYWSLSSCGLLDSRLKIMTVFL